jgi:hypothetical protein
MKRFEDRLVKKVGLTSLGASDLEATTSEGNLLPNKEKLGKNQGLGHGQGSRDSPTGLSRLERSCE